MEMREWSNRGSGWHTKNPGLLFPDASTRKEMLKNDVREKETDG